MERRRINNGNSIYNSTYISDVSIVQSKRRQINAQIQRLLSDEKDWRSIDRMRDTQSEKCTFGWR